MGMVDLNTGEYSNVSYGVDTSAANRNEDSVFNSIGDVVTKGLPLTGLSIVNSFANTGIELGNWLGAGMDKLTVQNEVGDGDFLGQNAQDVKDYYTRHEQGIEFAGLAIGSLIPGTIAIKALKLAQAGEAGLAIARATSIFSGPKQALIDAAVEDIGNPASLYNSFNADKYKAIAYGVGDQALQALVFQVATAGTMKASPILDDQGFGDLLENTFYGTVVGAGIGGLVEGIGIKGIFNKAILNADNSSKAQEIVNYLGQGGYSSGDRVAVMLASLDNIPVPKNALETAKLSTSTDKAVLTAKKTLQELTSENDPDLTNKFFDTLMSMKSTGGMDKDEMYQYLARLSSVTRVTGTDAGVPDGASFYINRIAKGETYGTNDLITAGPRYNFSEATTAAADDAAIKAAGTSLRYQLREGATTFKMARSSDIVDWDGTPIPIHNNATDAFAAGNDLFINKNNQISVNPNAVNIERVARPGESRILSVAEEKVYRKTGQLPEGKTLEGAPTTLDLITGSTTEDALPVVGDFGKVKTTDSGLMYGENFSKQTLDTLTGATTKPIDANARFVWAAQRGIKAGDSIAPNDIPFLEKLYADGTKSGDWTEYAKSLSTKGVAFSDGQSFPMTANGWLSKIQQEKNNLIQEVLSAPENSKLSSSEVAQLAGVKEDYLANMMKSTSANDFILDHTTESAELRHVKLWYDIGNTTIQDGMIARGALDVQYRVQTIKSAVQNATARYFGPDFGKFISTMNSSDANILGTGAKFLTSSNSDYGSLGQQMERIGKSVTAWYQKQIAAVNNILSAGANTLRSDPQLAAEVGMFRAVRQRTGESYSFLPEALAQKYGFLEADGSTNMVVLTKSLVKDKSGNIIDWDRGVVPENFRNGEDFSYYDSIGDAQRGNYTYYKLSPKAGDWERANLQINNSRIADRNNFNAAAGLSKTLPQDTLYTPPINTSNYRFFALAKLAPGTGMGEDDVAAITAASSSELQEKIAALRGQGLSVYTKEDLKNFHQVQGDYEYSRNFAQTQVNSALKSKGILNDILPETRAEGLIKDYVDWHSRQEMLLSRDYVELGNSQLFEELRAMGSRFADAETSRFGFVASDLGKTADNPYQSYINTALGISAKDNYRVWSQAQEVLESTFDSAFNTAKRALFAANRGIIGHEEASAMAQRFGLGNVYGNSVDVIKNSYYDIANKLPPARILSNFVSTANSILGATIIKLDTFQQMIHILSTPILTMAEANSAKQFLTTELPDGSGRMIPATSKIFFQALGDYFNKDIYDEWMPKYTAAGFIRDPDVLLQQHQLMDNLTLPYGKFSESDISQKLGNATKIAEKLVGTRFSEAYTSWMAARTGHLIFDAAGYEGQDLLDNIGTFVNRAKANVTASQRPVAFQGPLGQAVGLFQTYYLNLMQQAFRYVENGEGKTLAILGGIQTSLFGLSSLPGFQAINNHIIGNAAGNPFHKDLYSSINNLVDPKLGDYLLYGVTSNWLNAGLFSRGDTNPRQITLLPVNPLNYPAVAGGVRFVGNLLDTEQKIQNGGNVVNSLLLGLEHNGLSRPLAGLAQLVQGYATTSKGDLIAKTSPNATGDNSVGLGDLYDAGTFSRLLGARPLDEAVHLDALYRTDLYKAKDTARMEKLGEAAKTTMYANQPASPEEVSNFAQKYAASGGNISQFGRKMVEWSQEASASMANKIYRSLGTGRNQQAMMTMGGSPLPDYQNSPSEVAASTAASGGK